MDIGIELIMNEAKSRGIKVDWVVEPSDYSLAYNGRVEYFNYRYWSRQGLMAYELCRNKDRFKKLMIKNNLPAALGQVFKSEEFDLAVKFARSIGWPVVLKPHNESYGRGICLSLSDEEEFKKSWQMLSEAYETIIVEKMYFGKEYRIFATDEKVVAVLNRVPAHVIGDGYHSIEELIRIKNNDPARSSCRSMKDIVVDDSVVAKLKKDGYGLKAIPAAGKNIKLTDASNIRLGGDSKDVTDSVHPSVCKIAVSAIKAIPELRYGGLDFMTEDITVDQESVSHALIELNKSPGIGANHFPLIGKPRNCAGAIIDLAFPETAAKEER